ncbi:MAG: FKBP-type peptidyl-prolyl cis-trans isomerase [Bernardetiaceae bacterium]|nr:FKBP-type peptidyl-prolyl cis-trans isomerase [Bernardetiaceae bacterium]
MSLKINYLLIIVLTTLLFATNEAQAQKKGKILKTKTGLEYVIHEKGKGDSPQDSAFVEMDLILDMKTDVVINPQFGPGILNNTYIQGTPAFINVDMPADQPMAYITEILKQSKIGDSLTIFVHIDSLFSGMPKNQLPPFYEPDKIIEMHARIKHFYTPEEFKIKSEEMRQKMMQKQQEQLQKMKEEQERAEAEIKSEPFLTEEAKRIADYAKDKNIEIQKTEDGLFYHIEKQGEPIAKGTEIKVHYRGTLMDGTQFDSSYDRKQPIEIPIGAGRVIKGWDLGIPLIGKGGKGILLIPANLAYGVREQGPIPSKSALIFEVEVLED